MQRLRRNSVFAARLEEKEAKKNGAAALSKEFAEAFAAALQGSEELESTKTDVLELLGLADNADVEAARTALVKAFIGSHQAKKAAAGDAFVDALNAPEPDKRTSLKDIVATVGVDVLEKLLTQMFDLPGLLTDKGDVEQLLDEDFLATLTKLEWDEQKEKMLGTTSAARMLHCCSR